MRTITITQALSELKLYDAKISKAISESLFIDTALPDAKSVGQVDRETFIKNASADYQSITDLISNRASIKAAIAQSNAATRVMIGDREMTVAEAIEYKTSITYEEALLSEMREQYAMAKKKLEKSNACLQADMDAFVKDFYGGKEKSVPTEEREATEKSYRATHETVLVDPISIDEKIRALQDKIDTFNSNVDVALSISNSTTFIEVQ